MKYHLMPVRVVISKRQKITSVGKDVEKRELSCTFGGNINWCNHYAKQDEDASKKLKIELLYDPAIQLLGIFPEKIKH